MPALIPTDYAGRIVWMGRVPHRDRAQIDGEAVPEMHLSFAGLDGETHAGLTRPSCSRVVSLYPKETEIKNVRQLSVIAAEELAVIADKLGLDAIDPAWLGASLVVEGIPDFSHIPPSARLQSPSGATITVDMQNRPCNLVSLTIEESRPGHGKAFRAAAKGLRGVTAWVEREGAIKLGDVMRVYLPNQRAWAPEDE